MERAKLFTAHCEQNVNRSVSWTNSIHMNRGDVPTVDGSVQNTSSREFSALAENAQDNGSLDFLVQD